MESPSKKMKTPVIDAVSVITDSMFQISNNLESIGKAHDSIIRSNGVIINYLLSIDKKKQEQSEKIITQKELQSDTNSELNNILANFITMNQDYSKEVSFTSSYFVLADGLVSGLENCLANDVILDWFGKTISGRANVAAFMNTHKVNSRHVFNEIMPRNSIGYNKKSINRGGRHRSKVSNNLYNDENYSIEKSSRFDSTPVNKIISSGDRSRSSSKINANRYHLDDSDLSCELYNDELSNLFKLEKIKLTNIEEIEEQISQISLDEKLKVATSRKEDRYHKSKNVDALESSIKFVEAQGHILFSKKSRRQSGRNDCKSVSSSSTHTWRKPCKLQIAYSSQQISLQQLLIVNNNSIKCNSSSNFSELQRNLKFNKITERNGHLTTNNFSGFIVKNNFTKENSLNDSEKLLLTRDSDKLDLIIPQVDNQLVSQKIVTDSNYYEVEKNFIFSHLIHVIIYEGISRCRMNLSQKFT